MIIGLLDVDSHNFPNLPLMKISAYHKAKGDEVEMLNPFRHYDRVYASKVFGAEYSDDYLYGINADEIIEGEQGEQFILRTAEKFISKSKTKICQVRSSMSIQTMNFMA